jgi:hypothetical protein
MRLANSNEDVESSAVKRAVAVALAIVALAACHREQKKAMADQPTVPRFLEWSRLGTKVGPDGLVSEETTSFAAGEPVHLSLKLHETPPGLQLRAIWKDAGGKNIQRDTKYPKNKKAVTFTLQQSPPPGHYHVEAYWGGNLAADKDFDVVAKGKG